MPRTCGWTAGAGDDVLDFATGPARAGERAYYELEYAKLPRVEQRLSLEDTAAAWDDPIRPVNRVMWSLIGDLTGQTVLLIGNGGSAKELRLLTKQPRALIFSDLSTAGLAKIRDRYEVGPYRDRLVFAAIDALDLPLPDGSIDLVYGNAVVHHLPDIDRCLSEVARVLRPGGRAVFMDNAFSPLWQSLKRTLLRPLMLWSHLRHERSPEDRRETLLSRFREEDLAPRIRAAGSRASSARASSTTCGTARRWSSSPSGSAPRRPAADRHVHHRPR